MARIFVGLSGGVDSAVSAAILKEQGHEVTGVFIRIFRPEFIECTWKEDRLDAMRVCAALSIPFCEIDLSQEYKSEVVDTMITDYKNGITPNPDVLCNRAIKFGGFLAWAKSHGAERIATGHYAQIQQKGGDCELLRGADVTKDQSYFLYRLRQDDLLHTLFPVGSMRKADVRAKAEALGLPVATKRDSQGLCFIGDVSIADFLKRFVDIIPGSVLDKEGRVIGEHEGSALFTIGQRHGFTVEKAIRAEPQYVIGIDAAANTIVVSPHKNDAAVSSVTLDSVSWVGEVPADGTPVLAQSRYREQPVPAYVHTEQGRTEVVFTQRHVAPPGQSLVIYRENAVLGGGMIEKPR